LHYNDKRYIERIFEMENIENMTEALPMLDNSDARTLAEAIAEVLDSKKGKDIKVLHVEDKTVIAEYFVICSGNTGTQVKALAGEVEYKIGLRGVDPYQVEGRDNNSWLIVDYSNVIVHIFSREAREFYNLDKLYAD
jgi:ribosome-associated protein